MRRWSPGEMFWRTSPLPTAPAIAFDPLRIANRYGLFAVMTPHRYEIEFQTTMESIGRLSVPVSRRIEERRYLCPPASA
jgi:hypothetical protein